MNPMDETMNVEVVTSLQHLLSKQGCVEINFNGSSSPFYASKGERELPELFEYTLETYIGMLNRFTQDDFNNPGKRISVTDSLRKILGEEGGLEIFRERPMEHYPNMVIYPKGNLLFADKVLEDIKTDKWREMEKQLKDRGYDLQTGLTNAYQFAASIGKAHVPRSGLVTALGKAHNNRLARLGRGSRNA